MKKNIAMGFLILVLRVPNDAAGNSQRLYRGLYCSLGEQRRTMDNYESEPLKAMFRRSMTGYSAAERMTPRRAISGAAPAGLGQLFRRALALRPLPRHAPKHAPSRDIAGARFATAPLSTRHRSGGDVHVAPGHVAKLDEAETNEAGAKASSGCHPTWLTG